MKKKRIFWLGMHKVLICTELKRLRMLGYEVFNPPYLSSIIDQSALIDYSGQNNSTLPPEAIEILSKTNFFYASIPPQAAEILNYYFEAVIVTINSVWLKNILEVYHGKVIYRVYGQPYLLSENLTDTQVIDLISEHENFWFCPHHEKTLYFEDAWLKNIKTHIIPYCLLDDCIALTDQWKFQNTCQSNLGLMCPRILDNIYYNHHYKLIKKYFSDKQFKIFGVQILSVSDSQVVGTLERDIFLKLLNQLKGFIYHYSDPAICYLPPIEFMTLGGPVIFLKDSLLSRYFSQPPPGEAENFSALVKLAQRLKDGDHALVHEIIKSQEEVKILYHPNTVWPLFDKAMTEILSTNEVTPAPKFLYKSNTVKNPLNEKNSPEKFYLIPFHQLAPNIEQGSDLNYYSAEGIIRVMHLIVIALTQNNTVIVTSYRHDFGKIYSFFENYITDSSKLKLFIIEDNTNPIILKKIDNKLRIFLKRIGLKKVIKAMLVYFKKKPILQHLIFYFNLILYFRKIKNTSYIHTINNDESITQVILPHYFLFPEASALVKPMLLYLPDYLPHFYKGSIEMGDRFLWRFTGKKLAKKAEVILTNSEFTKRYLPYSVLRVKKEKIIHIPLPYLPPTKIDKPTFSNKLVKQLPDLFIFYPTRDRPSKRLKDFPEILRIINHRLKLKSETKRIYGVLTTSFLTKKATNKYVINLPTLSDLELTQVYRLASALVFTSENEGNFPTQINEALYLNTPVIATNIPQITLELGEISNFLQLVDVGDCEKFADTVLYTIDNREKVLIAQQRVRDYAEKHFNYNQFFTKFLAIFDKNFKLSAEDTTLINV